MPGNERRWQQAQRQLEGGRGGGSRGGGGRGSQAPEFPQAQSRLMAPWVVGWQAAPAAGHWPSREGTLGVVELSRIPKTPLHLLLNRDDQGNGSSTWVGT